MSVVLVGPPVGLGEVLIDRLRAQDDEVRVVEDVASRVEMWQARGAFTALASEWDADLIERASYGARTIVLFEQPNRVLSEMVDVAAAAVIPSGVDRVIVVSNSSEIPGGLSGADFGYVVLGIGKASRFRRGRALDDERVAQAIDAADDIEGEPKLALDLHSPSAWSELGLTP